MRVKRSVRMTLSAKENRSMSSIEKIFDDFADEYLQEQSERNIVIVASSKIDDSLYEILSQFLLPKIEKGRKQDELLEGDRPLATFSSRIKMIYRLGVVDKSFYEVLEKIREIRNASAHQIMFDLAKPPIKDKIQHLLTLLKCRESYKALIQRYFSQAPMGKNDEIKCAYLTVCMLLEAVKTKVQKIQINTETIRIAIK